MNAQKKAESQPVASGPGSLYEVLIEASTGHRTVRRLTADDEAAAVAVVEAELDPGTVILDSAPAGQGLGSE